MDRRTFAKNCLLAAGTLAFPKIVLPQTQENISI